MDDKQIIELYWNRLDDAIKETKEKYGQYVSYIAQHILQEKAVAEHCIEECYVMLWDSIPPRKPQSLKTYICKITRNHALHMRYPKLNEHTSDIFTAELIIQDFLKGLEPEQRKLFVARYWYFSSVSEIAMQYKMSESKVEKTVLSLRQKLDGRLEEKNISLQNEEELLFAMTETEDRYLAEAEPVPVTQEKRVKAGADINENSASDIQAWISKPRNKKWIFAISGIVLLVVVTFLWPKNPVGQTPSSTESHVSEGNNQEPDKMQNGYEGVLVHIVNGDYFTEAGFETYMSLQPWNKEMEIAALPVYKNLAFVDIAGYQNSGNTVFLSENDLVAMVENIASKVGMQVVHTKVNKTTYSEEMQNAVTGIEVTTDTGSIRIDGDGKVAVNFFEGIELPEEYKMMNSTSIEDANKIVNYLLEQYADLFSIEGLSPACYEVYDYESQRTMRYRAVERAHGEDGIADYYFNQVEFEYNEQLGLTGISYGDVRNATELAGYYPIISVEEAKEILAEGNASVYDINFTSYEVTLSDLRDASYVELMYYTPNQNLYYYYTTYNKYYQPYYCFYVKMGDLEEYCRYYVPAIKGATENEIPEQNEITILDLNDYEVTDGYYHKDGKYYTIQNGEIVETEYDVNDGTENYYSEYGETFGEIMEDGSTQWKAYYKGEEILNLDEVMSGLSAVNPDSYEIRYIDGDIVIICMEPRLEAYVDEQYATVFLYQTEDGTLRRLTDAMKMRSQKNPGGLSLTAGFYATIANEAGEVQILDLRTGQSVNTGIRYEDVESFGDASDEHFAFAYKTGEIAIVEKTSGQLIKKTKYSLNFLPEFFGYEDDMLYVRDMESPNLLIVIKEFE